MSSKKTTQSKVITSFRLSVGLNIILSLLILSTVVVTVWAYHQYKGGTQLAARFAVQHMYDYCDMHYKNIDKWLKEAEAKGQPWGTPEQIKEAMLNTNVVCNHEDFDPYLQQAVENYYNANGVEASLQERVTYPLP